MFDVKILHGKKREYKKNKLYNVYKMDNKLAY